VKIINTYKIISYLLLFVFIKANAALPVASFSLNPNIGCSVPHTTFFTDTSSGNPTITSWLWDFGDTNTSTSQNPVHNYLTSGDFTISLTVTNADGSDSTTTQVKVSVPTANFTGTPLFGCGPLDTTFTDTSTFNNSTASSWFWDFGDGGTSTAQNPNYTYDQPGIYTVNMTVTDANGCVDTLSRTSFVQVIGPKVSFTSNPTSGQVPLDVDFTDTSIFTSPPNGWTWDFGDGGSSNLVNPTHTYASQGVYATSLTVTDIVGCSRTEINGSTDGPVTVIADQVITFNNPGNQTYSVGGSFMAPATSDSGLTVTVTSNDLTVCTVSGNTVNIQSSGNCSLTASQAGSVIYNPAVDVNQVVVIAQATQTITFNNPLDQVFIAGGTFNAPATSDSGLTVSMTSNDLTVCTISGFTVTMLTPGVCSLTASQAGDMNYLMAIDVNQTVILNPADTDGVDDLIENAVPDADGIGFGDGDGNGILDSTESNVASFVANNGVDYLTVKSNFDLSNLNVSMESLVGLTQDVNFPYEFLGFTLNGLTAGETATVEVFVPQNVFVNSYWKQGNDSQWSNIATNITQIGSAKTKITIQLTEGGNFDSDADSTTLTDPGAAGAVTYKVPTNNMWWLGLLLFMLVVITYRFTINAHKKL
jgi:PKD repeat protein